jgi:hypothetical protein
MLERVARVLTCPRCGGDLSRQFPLQKIGGRLRFADLRCRQCSAGWGIREGVGIFATPTTLEVDWRSDPGLLQRPPDDVYWQSYLAALPTEAQQALEQALVALESAVRGLSGLLVDFSTCTGHVLRRVTGPGASRELFVGLDPELPRLYATQAALRRERCYSRVSLAQVEPRHWPLRDRCAQGVVSFYGPSLVPYSRTWFGEAARTLRPGAPFVFSTLLTREKTLTVRQASRLHMDETLTEGRLRQALDRNGFAVESWEVLAKGTHWPRNSFDPLPLEGDPWSHVLVRTRRKRSPGLPEAVQLMEPTTFPSVTG